MKCLIPFLRRVFKLRVQILLLLIFSILINIFLNYIGFLKTNIFGKNIIGYYQHETTKNIITTQKQQVEVAVLKTTPVEEKNFVYDKLMKI